MPNFLDRIKSAVKALRFPDSSSSGSSSPMIIFPTLNDMSAAVMASLSPTSQPSSDPTLSALVAAGYTWLGTTIAEPDIQVKRGFQRKRNGKKRDDDLVERHPFYDLLGFDGRPNPYTSASTLWRAWAYDWIIYGNAAFLKFRNPFGQITQLWYEPWWSIKARWVNDKQGEYITGDRSQSVAAIPRDDSPNAFINYYELVRDGQRYRVEPQDVVHFRDGIDPVNTRYGLSRLTTIFREIYGDSAVASYAADLLGGNGVIPYVLAIDDKEGVISEDDLLNIKTKMLAQTTGANAGKPIVVTSRATVQKTGLTPEELDLRAARSMSQDIFSSVTGIPAIVLNFSSGMERSIYNNMSEADRRAVTSYLEPLWWHRDQELTHQLLRDLDPNEQLFIESDLSEVGALKEDENELWKRLGMAYQDGWLKRSEVRLAADYEVDEGGADDVYLVRAGSETVTPEQEGIQRDASIEATQNPPEPEMLPQAQERPLLQAVNARQK